MTASDLILTVGCGALLVMTVIFFHTAEQRLAREARARALANQHAADAHAQKRRADLLADAIVRCHEQITFLATHNKELQGEVEELHHRILYLSSLVSHVDHLALARMAVMDRPLMWLPSDRSKNEPDTINLN